MKGKAQLSESGEDYLEAILLLGKKARPVRVKEIARLLNVSRPSVVEALQVLREKGLVKHKYYGSVELTPYGRACALNVYKRHLILEQFLSRMLGVSANIAARDACRLEHFISKETVKKLVGFIEKMKRDEET